MTNWRSFAVSLGRLRRERPDPAAGLGDLEAALACEGCPICARTAGADERWLDHFLYEGYQEPEVMRAVARGGGLCPLHSRRVETVGLSVTVGLIYLDLIEKSLPGLAGGGNNSSRALVAAPGHCEACAQASDVERRECFFLALLMRTRARHRYGDPAIACTRHLPTLIGYLGNADIPGVLAAHRRTLTELDASLASTAVRAVANKPASAADRTIRVLLGPPGRSETRPAALEFSNDRDPVSRMRLRMRHLQSCPICAEVDDACAEWLDWLARQAETEDDVSDVLPLCRDHAWRARCVGAVALAPVLAATVLNEAVERLVYAEKALEPARRAWFRPAARGAVLGSLGQGRECPLCRRAREAGQRAILLLTTLLKDADGRSAFESGYGLCVRHAAQALSSPDEHPARNIIAATMHARLALLRWEIEEQLRRGAWQARPERRGAESGAWLKAGARFAGTVRLASSGA